MSPGRMLVAAAAAGASGALVASAWMRKRGLAVMGEPLRQIANRGPVQFLVGEAFDMTSREAVDEALGIAGSPPDGSGSRVRIFLDQSGGGRGTYHPKVYLATSEETAWLFVGSQNLTPGGMGGNYEAGVCVVCEPDAQVIQDVRAWFDRLWRAVGCTMPAEEILHTLPSEDKIDARRAKRLRRDEEDDETGLMAKRRGLFLQEPWAAAPAEVLEAPTAEDGDVPALLTIGSLPPALRPVLARLHRAIMSLEDMRPGDPKDIPGGSPSYHLQDEPGKPPDRELFRLDTTANHIGVAVATYRSPRNQYTLKGWNESILENWKDELNISNTKRWTYEIHDPEDFEEAWRLIRELHATRRASNR